MKEQARSAFWHAEVLFRATYEKLLQQPAGTFHPGQPGRHKEQAELPRHQGGYNLPRPTLVNLREPAAAGAMVGIVDLLGQCKLLATEARPSAMVQMHICSTKRRLDLDQSAARQPVLSIHEQPEDSRDLLDTCGPTNRR